MPAPRLKELELREQRLLADRLRRKPPKGRPAGPAPTSDPLRGAFFVNWDEASLTSLKENANQLDLVFPEWFHVTGTPAAVRTDDAAKQAVALNFMRRFGTTELTERTETRKGDAGAALPPFPPARGGGEQQLRWLPVVNNFDGETWDGEGLARQLCEPALRARLITDLVSYAKGCQAAGVCVDFQGFPNTPILLHDQGGGRGPRPKTQKARPVPPYEGYVSFIEELASALRAEHLLMAVTAPVSSLRYPYRPVGQLADLVLLTAYDQHWASGQPGPIAAHDWFTTGLSRAAQDLPASKTLVALGNYAYDWTLPPGTVPDKPAGTPAAVVAYEQAVRLARNNKARWQWDGTSLNPFFGYVDEQRREHMVWLLDAVTAFNQMAHAQAAMPAGPRGFVLWRLGSEDKTVWSVWPKRTALDAAIAAGLRRCPSPGLIERVGQGETMRVTGTPAQGDREIHYDPKRGLIASAWYHTYPSPYVLTHYGAAENKVVLTFDDGPDPSYTPAILDILKDDGVPAVFFVVGSQAERHPALLERMAAEGHEVGSHTFTHPDISKISLRQLEVELSATQRLIESRLGCQTLLFRPPYGQDTEPRTLEEIKTVEAVNQLGYLCVGMRLDPNDWANPGVDEIVQRVRAQVQAGQGNVILLHDSGGDRAQTVAALPGLIAALREDGVEFVSLAQLLGLSREQLMPPLRSGHWRARLQYAGFGLLTLAMRGVELLFFLGIILGLARLGFIGVLAVWEHARKRRMVFRDDYFPPVAVIVPAYNEEKVVAQTVRSLLHADYRGPLEIIVVDDGSKDGTYRVAAEAFAGEPHVTVLTKPNGGKSAALNYGIARTSAEIVVGLDADTVFRPDTVSKLVRHFAAPGVGAVAGNAKVGNRLNLLTRWQALEYITCQNLDRRAFSLLNCITVVPGAVGAWRRKLVLQAGGFTHMTLAEDADLTMAIRRLGYRVVNEEEAVALTEAPDTVKGFLKQRFRWMFGTIQAAFHHKRALFNPWHGALGFVALPNIFIFQVLFPLISPVMDLTLLFSAGSWLIEYWHHPGQMPAGTGQVLWYYLLFVVVDYLAGVLAFALEPAEDKTLLVWLFLQRFFYRQLMYYVAIKSTLAALKGAAVGWGKLERKATVQDLEQPAGTG